jgi:hypothetical protein
MSDPAIVAIGSAVIVALLAIVGLVLAWRGITRDR